MDPQAGTGQNFLKSESGWQDNPAHYTLTTHDPRSCHMAKTKIFYSFHYDLDVFRVQQIRNIGALEGNEPVKPNEWEEVRKKGVAAVEKWIDETMKDRECVVVLIGKETSERSWVRSEICKGWNSKKGVVGIYIHNLKCPSAAKAGKVATCAKGNNPFSAIEIGKKSLSDFVMCHDPSATDAYGDIVKNLESWVKAAIAARAK